MNLLARMSVVLVLGGGAGGAASTPPLQPFTPDAHTLLLYHFDEGTGRTAHDAGGHGYDGEVQGARWATGRFGKALRFDGKDDCVFRKATNAICNVKQFTVECWFNQDDPSGRQFLVGLDVGFHFDVSEGRSTSLSIYNRGGQVDNAEGLRHQQVGTSLRPLRPGRWHHEAATYDGRLVGFFVDGVLRARHRAAAGFLLGAPSRGLWVGSYVGADFWFCGRLDEVRVSDCVRYDPDCKLEPGEKVFDMPARPAFCKQVRPARKTGKAELRLTLEKLYGSHGSGWVYLKPPGRHAVIVGQYALDTLSDGATKSLAFDVSDEYEAGRGQGGWYLVGLEPTDAEAYVAVIRAKLVAGTRTAAQWTGKVKSRRTFQPPVLVPLQTGAAAKAADPRRLLLLPAALDRRHGDVEVDRDGSDGPVVLSGDGFAEWWLFTRKETTYRVHLRYATRGLRPCDMVVDGRDLNRFEMCAVNRSLGAAPRDALWELQGRVTLKPGPHWLRLQGVLPGVVALWLEPVSARSPVRVPWKRFPVPRGGFLTTAGGWKAAPVFGAPSGSRATPTPGRERQALRVQTTFTNTDPTNLFAGDRVRFVHRGRFNLEPFGRLRFRFTGDGTGHVAALWLVDVTGKEKLVWRARADQTNPQDIAVPLSFEGNTVFDPGRVVAVCIDLDEGNVNTTRVDSFAATFENFRLERRDEPALPTGYAGRLRAARAAYRAVSARLPTRVVPLRSPGFRPWTTPVVPEEHPLFAAAEPKPVTRKTLGYDLHFTGARNVAAATLDDFHRFYDFGDICWPHIGILPLRSKYKTDAQYRSALNELEVRLKDVRRRGLIVWDIWGYVPYNPRFPGKVAPEHHRLLLRVLGDRFLGYDNGEQDGRYIGGYADRDPFTTRKEGWRYFVQWDRHICTDGMNYMNATGSLNFSHYYAERGCRTLGLETAQGLPSDTLMFAFLRGAAKQYGRLTTQATSVWNRFGYKLYTGRKTTGANGYGYGPNKGCSLSLHKRLFFAGYLGGDSIVGTETGQFTADRQENGAPELSPLGRQHLRIRQWVKAHPGRGVLYTPVAFMLDFYTGWNPPRHLYRRDRYKVWGKLPYEKGDYLMDAVFRFVWPGYQDCSYLRNERGFICNTPFGDLFDVITNRCGPVVLNRYSAVMLLGEVEWSPALSARLLDYVRAGGDLLLEARLARNLPEAVVGLRFGGEAKGVLSSSLPTGESFPELPFTYTHAAPTTASPLLVSETGDPLVTVNRVAQGRVIVTTVDRWLTDVVNYNHPDLVNMEPPHLLLRGVRHVLEGYFGSFRPVQIEPEGLNVRTCCFARDSKRLLVGLTNNDLFADWNGTLTVRVGRLRTARQLWPEERSLPRRDPLPLHIPAGEVTLVDLRLQ